jgi:dihydroorotase
VVDLPTTMSRHLALGMPLPDVVAASTATPAAMIGRPDLGALRAGNPGDVTVMRLDPTQIELPDSNGIRRTVPTRLVPVLTVVAGVVHRATDVHVPLRPYLDADREVDCAVPI